MKEGIRNVIITTLSFCFLSCTMMKKGSTPFIVDSQNLLSKKFDIQLPEPFLFQKSNYEEGVVYCYSFPNGSYVIVFQGSLMQFPIDNYTSQKQVIQGRKKINTGKINNRFWRKDIFDDVRIYYDNVPGEKKKIFDKILDTIKFEQL